MERFPARRDWVLLGLVASMALSGEHSKPPVEVIPAPIFSPRVNPTLGPAIEAVRVPSKDRGVGH